METASIIIPSIGRSENLRQCLQSIREQTYTDYKIYIINDLAPLFECRNRGALKALGYYIIFIDDDVVCHPKWLESIINTFKSSDSIAGVSGPAIIQEDLRQNRDLFKYKFIKKYVYDKFFCESKSDLPGRLMKSGAFTTGSSSKDCHYEGEVDFLEACNMAFVKSVFNRVGMFSNEYKGVGEWQEPDVCFAIKKLGYKMWFNPKAKVYHNISQQGAYKRRFEESKIRYSNYLTFSKKWIKPHWKHTLFKLFMNAYYAYKTSK